MPRPAPEKKMYFAEDQQKAVVQYRDAFIYNDKGKKIKDKDGNFVYDDIQMNIVYRKHLHKPFLQMIASIVRRYSKSFTFGSYSIDEMEHMALQHLIEQFRNFDEWKPDVLTYNTTNKKLTKILELGESKFKARTNIDGIITEVENVDCIDPLFVSIKRQLKNKQTLSYDKEIDCVFLVERKKKKNLNFKITTEGNSNDLESIKQYYREKLDFDTDETPPHIDFAKITKRNVIYCPINSSRSAFSYCQTIIKNYYNTHSKITYKEKLRQQNYEYSEELEDSHLIEEQYKLYEEVYNEVNYNDFFDTIIEDIEYTIVHNDYLSDEEKLVGDTVKYVFENWENIFPELTPEGNDENLNITNTYIKRKLFIIIRERTNLVTKDIRNAMSRFNKLYNITKNSYFDE